MPNILILVRTVENQFQKSCRVFNMGPNLLLPSCLGLCINDTYVIQLLEAA